MTPAEESFREYWPDCEVRFVPMGSVKVRWERGPDHARFEISDALSSAPKEIFDEIAGVLYNRIVLRLFTEPLGSKTEGWVSANIDEARKRVMDALGAKKCGSVGDWEIWQCDSVIAPEYRELIRVALIPSEEYLWRVTEKFLAKGGAGE